MIPDEGRPYSLTTTFDPLIQIDNFTAAETGFYYQDGGSCDKLSYKPSIQNL